MKKFTIVAAVTVSLAGLAIGAFSLAKPATSLPDKVTLQCGRQEAPVTFDHRKHTEQGACSKCHHTQQGLKAGDKVEVQRCVSCHMKQVKPTVLACSSPSMTKNPLHIGCVNCHEEKGQGPTSCGGCHRK